MGCRDLNAFTSQEVFAGPYLDEPGVANEVSEAYRNITNGFLAFPLCVPGTAVWKGKQGRLYILKTLRGAAARAKAAMQVSALQACCWLSSLVWPAWESSCGVTEQIGQVR